MRHFKVLLAISAAFLVAAPGVVWAQQGFGSESGTTETQGNSGKTNTNANPDNEGQVETTTTTTGPRGALKNDKTTPNQETTTTTTGPGNSN